MVQSNGLEDYRPLLGDLVDQGYTNLQIQEELARNHDTHCSLRTITRARTDWDLQIRPNNDTYDLIDDLIILYHGQGMRVEHVINIMKERHGLKITPRTLARRSHDLGLHRRHDDIDLGRVTMEEVADMIRHCKRMPDGKLAGYRRIHHILRNQHGVHVHRDIVAAMVKQMDADGVEARLRRSIRRRVFYVPGPNHAWSADGHDKLKKFGITLYGIIDAWSRRVLGIFVHVTNNNPAHIGLYFLEVVKKVGGIPQKTVTDHGTETINLAAHQIELAFEFGNLTAEEASACHQFTDSPHNQKIECLWSQLMIQLNTALIDMLFESMESGQYNSDDPLQRVLFLYLWVPLIQDCLDKWMNDYNTYSKRTNSQSMLPGGCSPDLCYYAPASKDGVEGLIPIPAARVEELKAQNYPNAEELMATSPMWLREMCTAAAQALDIDLAKINIDNVWTIFHKLLDFMCSYDSFLLRTPDGVQRAPTNHEQALATVEARFGRLPNRN